MQNLDNLITPHLSIPCQSQNGNYLGNIRVNKWKLLDNPLSSRPNEDIDKNIINLY